jgi:dolichyl-phosphate-mannose-protein mannosyltransferase
VNTKTNIIGNARFRVSRRPSSELVLVLMGGLVVRLWAMQWPPLPQDINAFLFWAERMLQVGPGRFYDPSVFADYAPGYLYVLWLTAAIREALLPDAARAVSIFLIRIVPVLCDLGTAALVFEIVRRWLERVNTTRARTWAAFAAACHAFNPAVVFNSATWSQVDSTFTLLMLAALVLIAADRIEWAAVCYVVAFLIKPQAISLAPLLIIVGLLCYPWRRWLRAGLLGLGLMFVLIVPFFGLQSFAGLIVQLQGSVETYPYTSLFTFNLWGIRGFWDDDTVPLVAGLSARSIGTLLYLLGLGYGGGLLVRRIRRGGLDTPTLFVFATYFAFLPVMVLTRMHERYLFPVLPLLLVWVFTVKARRRWQVAAMLGYGALTVLHTINLLYVYWFYLYYPDPVPQSIAAFYSIERGATGLSILTLLLFAITVLGLSWLSLRSSHQNRSQTGPTGA